MEKRTDAGYFGLRNNYRYSTAQRDIIYFSNVSNYHINFGRCHYLYNIIFCFEI